MRIAAAALTLALAACSMADSSLIGQADAPSGLGCRGTSGAYYLSKTYFKVKVVKHQLPGGAWVNELVELVPTRRPDRNHGYCLDYLASATADEKLHVKMDNDFLLQSISSEAVDQSGYIIKTLIRAAFTGITHVQARSFRSHKAQPVDVFEGEWDPINKVQSAVVNSALKDAGFCVIVEGATFDLARQTVDSYCNDPASAHAVKNAPREAFEEAPAANRRLHVKGIAYRPRVPHAVYVFVNPTPGKRGRWTLAEVKSVPIENDQPTVSVGVDRSFFAARKTSLVFDQGALRNICVHKTSELLEVSTIPLEVAKNIVALPTNVIQLKVQNTNNYAELINAENELIKTQESHLKALKTGEGDRYGPKGGGQAGNSGFKPAELPERLPPAVLADVTREEWNRVCPQVLPKKTALGGGGDQ